MLFNSFPFLLFFLTLLVLIKTLPRRAFFPTLLGASLLFYAAWYPVYLLLLLAEVVANYGFATWMLRSKRPKAVLTLSIIATLGVLGWFKYSTLAIETFSPMLAGWLGIDIRPPDFFLPLGISFYTFQMIALSVDLYRGHVKELPSFPRYLLFVSFFPQLIAGPIVRGRELLPQLEVGGRITSERSRRGIWLISSGLAKKVIMGDFLLAPLVDQVFEAPGVGSGAFHLVAMYAFAFQIYFDFSGYTDMARGLACLLGYELPANFREPYLSVNPAEFWRRWHITLSSWFRDYLYIPLGGNRGGEIATYRNLLLTMLLCGLWHGADWHFVMWGLYHGLLLAAHRLSVPLLAKVQPTGASAQQLWLLARWFVTSQLVFFGWILFRADSNADALTFLSSILTNSYEDGFPPLATLLVLLSLGLHALERWIRENAATLRDRLDSTRSGLLLEGALVGIVLALTFAASGTGQEFIYFQF